MISPETDRLILAGLDLGPKDETFPFINGAGSVNGAGEGELIKGFEDLVRAPGAAVMIGSITLEPRRGNSVEHGDPVYMHIPGTGLTYNSMGLPNIGIDGLLGNVVDMRLLAESNGKELAVSLAPMTKDPYEEWSLMAYELLEKGVKIIEFNAGCPNIFDENGNPKAVLSHEPDLMGEALDRVMEYIGNDFVAGIKISPAPVRTFGPDYQLDEPAERLIARQAGVINALKSSYPNIYVAHFNTFGGQIPVDENGKQIPLSVPTKSGGVSGIGVAHVARTQTQKLLWYLDPEIDVVAAGGIGNGQELAERLAMDERIKLGSAVTLLWQAVTLGKGATNLAIQYAEALQEADN